MKDLWKGIAIFAIWGGLATAACFMAAFHIQGEIGSGYIFFAFLATIFIAWN